VQSTTPEDPAAMAEVLRSALGERLAREYLVVKRSEVRGFEGKGLAFEIEHHFYRY
jgi:glutamine synthetase